MITDSKVEMGNRFKNSFVIKVLGWLSVIGLTVLNMIGLPDAVLGFFGDKPTAGEQTLSTIIAYLLVAAILALLVWTVYDLRRGNRRYAEQQATTAKDGE